MKLVAIALLILLLAGCAICGRRLYLLIRQKEPRALQVKISGEGVLITQMMVIRDSLQFLPDEMLMEDLEVNIVDDQKHLGMTWDGRQAAGHHCIPCNPYTVCIFRNSVESASVFHEVAHAYHYFLHTRTAFTREWQEIAGDVYTKDAGTPNGQGIVDSYCRVNVDEDVARWVEYCYLYIQSPADNRFAALPDLKSDPRYRQKLALLHAHKFFSDADYAKLKPLFQ